MATREELEKKNLKKRKAISNLIVRANAGEGNP